MGMTKSTLALLLIPACLSAPTEDGNARVDVNGVRLIGTSSAGGVVARTACQILMDCCPLEFRQECIDQVSRLTEQDCEFVLEDAPQCQDDQDTIGIEGEAEAEAEAEPEPEGDECCSPDDPCGWEDDGFCDCIDEDWDFFDCNQIPPDAGP